MTKQLSPDAQKWLSEIERWYAADVADKRVPIAHYFAIHCALLNKQVHTRQVVTPADQEYMKKLIARFDEVIVKPARQGSLDIFDSLNLIAESFPNNFLDTEWGHWLRQTILLNIPPGKR